MGRPSHEIPDGHVNRLYPSFVELLHSGSRLSDYGENERISITVTVKRVSARRIWSVHDVRNPDSDRRLLLEMLTLSMKRSGTGTENATPQAHAPDQTIVLPDFDAKRDTSEILGRRERSYDAGSAEAQRLEGASVV